MYNGFWNIRAEKNEQTGKVTAAATNKHIQTLRTQSAADKKWAGGK